MVKIAKLILFVGALFGVISSLYFAFTEHCGTPMYEYYMNVSRAGSFVCIGCCIALIGLYWAESKE